MTKNQNLERFKDSFHRRYEGQKIPLLQVLDVESGIGYVQNPNNLVTTPFLDDIDYVGENMSRDTLETSWSSFHRVLHKKLYETISINAEEIKLTDRDFPSLEYDWLDAPETISVMFEAIIEKGQEKIVMDYCGPWAAKLLGRFCYGDDGVKKMVNEIVATEKELLPDKVLAEIVHLPESRTGNILRRPSLRAYEIPYLGKSNLARENQISLTDILVAVEQGNVKLYSKKIEKEIIPCLTNAHNYTHNALPIYQFLCDLQYQNRRNYSFNWGNLSSQFRYLPRVTYKDVILSKAIWNLEKKDVENILNFHKKGTLTIQKISSWRISLKLPKLMQLVERDNTLLINFENLSSSQMLFDQIKNADNFRLEEFLFNNECLVRRGENGYCNQFVVAFHKEQPEPDGKI